MARTELVDDTTEVVVFKVETCKAICNNYPNCGNITRALTDDKSESLIAPCHWEEGATQKQAKKRI